MTKLPKAAIETTAFSRDSSTHSYYTEAQMLQFRRDALDEAAKACQGMKKECGEPDSMQASLNRQMMSCADAIRKLKDAT